MSGGNQDDVADRLRDRFGGDSDDDETDGEETNAKNAQNAMHVKNVKESWAAKSVYLPDFLQNRLKTTHKRTDLGFEEEFGQELPKTRFYYPMVVMLGLDAIEEMEATEIKECMERLEEDARGESTD